MTTIVVHELIAHEDPGEASLTIQLFEVKERAEFFQAQAQEYVKTRPQLRNLDGLSEYEQKAVLSAECRDQEEWEHLHPLRQFAGDAPLWCYDRFSVRQWTLDRRTANGEQF